MPVEVAVWMIPGHPRSKAVCSAMMQGIALVGDKPTLRASLSYIRPEGDVGLFYGLANNLAKAFGDYPARKKTAVYVDMGYFGRKAGGRFAGFHKLAVNSRHPTAYFQNVRHSAERFESFGVELAPWREARPGAPILIAGMGPKGSRAEGYGTQGWEREVLPSIRAATRRPIWYRAKPNWDQARDLPGAISVNRGAELIDQLQGAHALVAHHSNAAVEAVCAGIPVFVKEGVAVAMGESDFRLIETPRMPSDEERRQWLADIAWTQWSIEEMAEGLAWRYLKDEGLVP